MSLERCGFLRRTERITEYQNFVHGSHSVDQFPRVDFPRPIGFEEKLEKLSETIERRPSRDSLQQKPVQVSEFFIDFLDDKIRVGRIYRVGDMDSLSDLEPVGFRHERRGEYRI